MIYSFLSPVEPETILGRGKLVLTEELIVGERSYIYSNTFKMNTIFDIETSEFRHTNNGRLFKLVYCVMDTEEEAILVAQTINGLHPNSKKFKTALTLISDVVI